jgi:hypothetical protein
MNFLISAVLYFNFLNVVGADGSFLKRFYDTFRKNRIIPTPSYLTPGEQKGYLQYWYYNDEFCADITEIDSIHLQKCIPWWQVNPQTHYAYLTANITNTDPKQYAVSISYFSDSKCTQVSYDTEVADFEMEKCHDGYFVQIESEPPRPPAPGITFIQYGTNTLCQSNNITNSIQMKWLPFKECLYNGTSDYMFTSCNSKEITGETFTSADLTCENKNGKLVYDQSEKCKIVDNLYTNYQCVN